MRSWRLGVLLAVGLLIALPLSLPFVELLGAPDAWDTWQEVERLTRLARNTALLVLGILALALPLGTFAALLFYRTDLPGRSFFCFLSLITLFIPLPLFASAWQAALGSGGLYPLSFWTEPIASSTGVSGWSAWGRGLNAAIWIHAVAALPWVVLLVGNGLCWVEPELEEDALTITGPWRVLWYVTLPRSTVALAAAALWITLQAATEIAVTDMFQVRTFAEEIYTQFVASGDDATTRAVAVSVPAVVLTGIVVFWATRYYERRLPPREMASTDRIVFRLGRLRWPLFVLVLLAMGLLAGVPLSSLIWKLGQVGPRGWSADVAWEHLHNVLRVRGGLVIRSFLLAEIAGVAIALLALVACWCALGSRRFLAVLLVLVSAAWAIPGPIAGLGLKSAIHLLHDLDPQGPLARLLYYGPSPAPLLWADLVRFFPHAVAVLWPVVRLFPPDLRDAARVDGASATQEFGHLVWPLTRAAWLRSALVIGVLSFGELSAGKLIGTPGSQSFTHEVFVQMHYGLTNDLAALCLVLLMGVLVGGMLVALVRRFYPSF